MSPVKSNERDRERKRPAQDWKESGTCGPSKRGVKWFEYCEKRGHTVCDCWKRQRDEMVCVYVVGPGMRIKNFE